MSIDHDSASGSFAPGSDAPYDPLSDVLSALRLTGAIFFEWNVSWPYTETVPAGSQFASVVLPGAHQVVSYHIVLDGTAWASQPGGEPIHLEAGDILLVPRGHAYAMSSSRDACVTATVQLATALEFFGKLAAGALPLVLHDGGGGARTTRVVCGFLGCDDEPFNPVLQALPPLVRLRSIQSRKHDRLQNLLDLALAECRTSTPGSRNVLLRCSELMFVEVVRRCALELPIREQGWVGALRDPIAGKALVLLHRDPARRWTLESLASAVGISRSQLAERFTRCLGEPPIFYLTRWRIQLATRLLADHETKVATVAGRVGYGSEAAFSRAFKRCLGVSPLQWRRASERAG